MGKQSELRIKDLPAWLQDPVEEALGSFEIVGAIGWRYLEEDECHQIWIYPGLTEIVGGNHDGEIVSESHWSLSFEDIIKVFDKSPNIAWCHFLDDITEISIEGKVDGHDVWFHFLDEAPDDTEPMSTFDAQDGSMEEKEAEEENPSIPEVTEEDEAKAIVAMAFRNGPLEDAHASKSGKLDDAMMKTVMKNAVDKIYSLMRCKEETPEVYKGLVWFTCKFFTSKWDSPKRVPLTGNDIDDGKES